MSVTTPLRFALDCAGHGLAVFPCLANKAPATSHGHYDASTDIAQLRKWFDGKTWDEVLIATPAGTAFSVVDCDGESAVKEFLRRTPEAEGWASIDTPHGKHYYVQATHTSRSIRAVELPDGQGIDVLGNGYVIIAGPGRGNFLPVLNDLYDLPQMPNWLAKAAVRRAPRELTLHIPKHLTSKAAIEFGEKIYQTALITVAQAPRGQRHDVLLRHSYLVGSALAGGLLDKPPAEVIEAMAAASITSGHEYLDAQRTAADGIATGLKRPIGNILSAINDASRHMLAAMKFKTPIGHTPHDSGRKQDVDTAAGRVTKEKKEKSMNKKQQKEIITLKNARWAKLDSGWAVEVPTGSIQAGDTIQIARKDGSTTQITVQGVSRSWSNKAGESRMFAYPEHQPRDIEATESAGRGQQQEKVPTSYAKSISLAEVNAAPQQEKVPATASSDLQWRKLEKGWVVEAPAGQLSPGDVVNVPRKDGSTAEVTVRSVSKSFDRDGEAHVFAYPAHHPPTATEPPATKRPAEIKVEQS